MIYGISEILYCTSKYDGLWWCVSIFQYQLPSRDRFKDFVKEWHGDTWKCPRQCLIDFEEVAIFNWIVVETFKKLHVQYIDTSTAPYGDFNKEHYLVRDLSPSSTI